MLNTHKSLILLPILLSGVFLFSPISRPAYATEFSLPVSGYISTYFSALHPGVDIATDYGVKIRPIGSGIIENIAYDKSGYGTHIVIAHADQTKSLYAHLDKVLVRPAQVVDTATEIGTVGMTGHTSGPHAHIEIITKGNPVDPILVLPALKSLKELAPVVITKPQLTLSKNLKPDFSGI